MPERSAARDLLIAAAASLMAFLIAVLVVRPLAAPQVGFDTAASVLHFQRLVAGERLEAFVTTTPKPLLTLVFGVLHGMAGWAGVAWASMAMHGLATGLSTLLAARLAGPAAAALVAVAVAGSSFLLLEASYAYAVPWSLALWAAAGLALTRPRPLWGVAAVCLLLSTLARFETIVLVAAIAAALAAATFALRVVPSGGRLRQLLPHAVEPRAWRLVGVPLLALPIMLLHDWLLTGDPLFWASVSARYTAAARQRGDIAGPAEVGASLVDLVAANGALVVLALMGLVGLLVRRQWPALVGLLGLGPGIAAFLVLLAARGTYVSGRYEAPVDLAVLFAAGIGAGALVGAVVGRLPRPQRVARLATEAGLTAAVVVLGLLALAPWGPFDEATRSRIANERALQANAARVEPLIGRALDSIPGSRERPTGDAGVTVASGRSPVLLVPGLLRPRMAIDLDVPVDLVAGLTAAGLTPERGLIAPGQVIYHDRRGGQAGEAFAWLEIAEPFADRGLQFRPLLAEPDRGVWVIEVAAP